MINEIIDKLKEDNFEVEYTGYLCGYITDIDLIDHKGRYIQLHASFSKEYEEELESLPEGTEYDLDFSRIEYEGAWFKCVMCYNNITSDPDRFGIVLNDSNTKLFWHVYNNIFSDLTSWSIRVMEAHIKHIKYFNTHIKPILEKYDFIPEYNSYYDVNERYNIGSDPMFTYRYAYNKSEDLYFSTDSVNLKFTGTINPYSKDFEKELIEFMKIGGRVKLEYERFFTDDKTFTPTSHQDIYNLMSVIMSLKRGIKVEYNINFDNIPKTYHHLIEKYNTLKNKL